MFRAIETTAVVFTKRPKVKTRRSAAPKRADTPRPTDEQVLEILTAELTVMPTVAEESDAKKVKPGM